MRICLHCFFLTGLKNKQSYVVSLLWKILIPGKYSQVSNKCVHTETTGLLVFEGKVKKFESLIHIVCKIYLKFLCIDIKGSVRMGSKGSMEFNSTFGNFMYLLALFDKAQNFGKH